MPLRLLVGLIKGILLGGIIGYALSAAGLTLLPAWAAYGGAVLVGLLVALVAGKPIWAEDARIEVGAKAVAGAVVAPGLMALVRNFLEMGLPFSPSTLPGVAAADGITLGTFAITSFAIVAAVLAGFFDADNDGTAPPKLANKNEKETAAPTAKRFDVEEVLKGVDLEELEEQEAKAGRRAEP